MDYLDPKKAFRHTIVLYTGYICIAVGVVIATMILVYQAYGFGIGKNGAVIQNGLVFFSSQPNQANIYLSNQLDKSRTNARKVLPEGIYKVRLSQDGYRDWQRTIEVDGGSVQHYDYPLLFPKTLTSKKISSYQAAPGLYTQSPDKRWLMVQQANLQTSFDVYDLKNPSKAPEVITLPEAVLAKNASGTWALNEWANDNEHVLLTFTSTSGVQQILVDRIATESSVNLTSNLSLTGQDLSLRAKKYNQYFVYDKAAGSLQTETLKEPTLAPVLEHVLAYKSYSDNTLLYATDAGAPSGKVLVKLKVDDKTYPIKTLDAGTTYLLDVTGYDGKLYVVAGAASMNKVFIYRDPVGQLRDQPQQAATPSQVLHLISPNYISFSNNAQYIVAENSQQFGVYDIENQKGYNYTATSPIDTPQLHATWMDGNRLSYISNGKLVVFDYDHTNEQSLVAADARYVAAYAPDYKFIYTLAPTGAEFQLTQASLLTAADQ